MASRLIINADDFGLTSGINRSIATLYRAGVLSSATLMANGGAFDDAVLAAKENTGLGVGCHVVLVDGDPLSPRGQIPTLLGPDRNRLRPSLAAFAQAALLGQLEEEEIEREASAQIERLIDAGITPTHIDSHKHTHMFPSVLRPLLRVAKRFGIAAIRNPFEGRWSRSLGRARAVRRLQVRLLGVLEPGFHRQIKAFQAPMQTTAGALGVSATGTLDESTLTTLLHALPSGSWELVCHPGACDAELQSIATRLQAEREVEMKALLKVIPETLTAGEIKLVSFRDLRAADQAADEEQAT